MRSRIVPTITSVVLVMAMLGGEHLVGSGSQAAAQSLTEAESEAEEAAERAEVASGLVDEAVADRVAVEIQMAETMSRLSDISASLAVVGAGLDHLAGQLGYAEIELASIRTQIEAQAVDAYMTVLASPSMSLVGSETVEHALVASSVVEDVVASGRESVGELTTRKRSLEHLQQVFLDQREEYLFLEEEMSAEVERLASLYDEADAAVADAIRHAQTADAEYRAALSAVDLARARQDEQRRQESRSTTTTTTTTTTTLGTTSPRPTTVTTQPTTTSTTGGTGSWDPPPEVERWRSLVAQFFPASRVEQALRIIDCESNGDPDAYNPYSGASGLFQFLPSTWATTSPKAGYPGASAFDPEANVASAAWLANRYQQLGLDYWQPWHCRRVLD